MTASLIVPCTLFASAQPLTKLFDVGPDGGIRKSKGVSFAVGRAARVNLEGATPHEVLTVFSGLLDGLSAHHAIGLGVERSGVAAVDVVTAAMAATQGGALSRTLVHWHYPPGPGLFCADFDGGCGFNRLAADVYPPWGQLATLTRPSVSGGISNPLTGEIFQGSGEHVYALVDELPQAKTAAEALHHLFWLHGLGRVLVAKNGALHDRSPIDLAVFSPERVVYEGAARILPPLIAAPRACTVQAGGILVARDLIAFAAARISAADAYDLFVQACQDRAILALSEAKQAQNNAERRAQGKPPIGRAQEPRRRAVKAPAPRTPTGTAPALKAAPGPPQAPRKPIVPAEQRNATWRAARWRDLQAWKA